MMRRHPVTMISFLTILFFMILLYNNPVYILSILAFLSVLTSIVKDNKKLSNMMRYCLYNVLIIMIINPLLSREGQTVLFQSHRIPIIGRIKITGEALAYGANMGLKLACIVLVFVIYGMMTHKDDTFSFFSKFAHKLTLTFSLTVNIIHRLKVETTRVKEVMEMRGVNFSEKKIKKRVEAYYPLLKVVFISALEGSIDRAEALHSRGYGKYKRTNYVQIKMSLPDYFLLMISAMLFLFMLSGMVNHVGNYSFYPSLQRLSTSDFIWLSILDFIFIITLLYVWGCRHWKLLKCKT